MIQFNCQIQLCQQDLDSQLEQKAKENKDIDYLQELNESKQLCKQFQDLAEKAKKTEESLLEEYDRLRKTIEDEKDTVAKGTDKLSCCNLELEEQLKQIIPDYEVHIIAS